VISAQIYPDEESTGAAWFSEKGSAPDKAVYWPLA